MKDATENTGKSESPVLLDGRGDQQIWHTPTLNVLRVSLDTAIESGSGSDGDFPTVGTG